MKSLSVKNIIRYGILLGLIVVGLSFMGSTSAIGAIELGLILSIMSLGTFISFRVLNVPDATIDGSFSLGAAVSAILTLNGHPLLGILLGMLAGALAGSITAVLQTKLKIQPILAGILTMTALYSINIRVMGKKPNISLYMKQSIFTPFKEILSSKSVSIVIVGVILVIMTLFLFAFLKTQIGTALRATGDNEAMVRASSINTDTMKIIGLAIANGLVALAGSVMAQYMQVGDTNSGTGMMVTGFASIIIGESILNRGSIARGLLSAIIGSILYRFIISGALKIGVDAIDFKLMSALIVIISISVPTLKRYISTRRDRHAQD